MYYHQPFRARASYSYPATAAQGRRLSDKLPAQLDHYADDIAAFLRCQYENTCELFDADSKQSFSLIRQYPQVAWMHTVTQIGPTMCLFNEPGGPRGCYTHEPPIIAINNAYSIRAQTRVIIHELAHHIQAVNDPDILPDYRAGYDEDPSCVRHQLARRVERLMERYF